MMIEKDNEKGIRSSEAFRLGTEAAIHLAIHDELVTATFNQMMRAFTLRETEMYIAHHQRKHSKQSSTP